MSNTPRLDAVKESLLNGGFPPMMKMLGELEIELAEATRLRDEWAAENDKMHTVCENYGNSVLALIENRNQLAEAMIQMWPFIEEDDYQNCNTPPFNDAIKKYKEALATIMDITP